MPLPLYRQEEHKRDPFIKQQIHAGNTGLRYNKYFTLWDSDWTIKDGDKSKWIKKICERPAGDRKLLAETSARLISLTDHLGGEFRCYKTIWHFVSGLGLNNPVENGMAWHHTLGVPYLPGSSVKGLVRAWVEQWLEHSSQDEINRIFGPRGTEKVQGDNKAMRAVGNIIFFDALPTAPVRLAADVMTPHYQKYYGGTGPPGDWLDPNPIPFLTVDKEQVFLFAVAPRKRDDVANRSDLEAVLQWLEQSLENIGAGAKTATGYGRFTRSAHTESRLKSTILQRKKEKAGQASSIPMHLTSPIAEEMIKDQYDTDPDEFLKSIKTKWLSKMQADEISSTDQQKIAKLLKNWYHMHREGQWEKPNKKNTPIIEAIRRALGEEAP
jgi:CRISPR-associated protein Cmr6